MKSRIIILLLLISISVISLSAQDLDNLNQNDELEKVKRTTELTKEHKFLTAFVGNWKIKGINSTGQAPEAIIGKAMVKSILNGHYIEIDMALEQFAGKSHSRIFIGFDTRFNKFSFYNIDDYSNFPLESSGVQNKQSIIFEGKDYSLFLDKDLKFRIEFNKERENKFSYKVYELEGNSKKLVIEYYFYKQ